MKIKADKEGVEAIHALCDLALRAGGKANLNTVNQILSVVKEDKSEQATTVSKKKKTKKKPEEILQDNG